jgi:hypothetical protein
MVLKALQEKCIRSSAFLCFSGPMFITENTFLGLKTDVHNLCTSARTEEHKVNPYVPWPGQIPEEHNDLCSSTRSVRSGPYVPRPRQISEEHNDLCSSVTSGSSGI